MKLSEKLIKLRKEKGLSQEEFGNEINVSRQAVSKWETEEASPDTDKIKEIVEKFGVSFEYLLNDEIESEENVKNMADEKDKKHTEKIMWRLLLVIVLLYLLVCVYKFIAFYRFYLIANSFSEEKYSMSQTLRVPNQPELQDVSYNTTRVGNKIIEYSYNFTTFEPKDENGDVLPYDIEFTDIDKKICYQLTYDEEKNGYIYRDRKDDMVNEEEIEALFRDENRIKENTLSVIPSGFKEILLASIDPRYYYVSIRNRQFRIISIAENVKMKIQLNQDCLVEGINQKFGDTETIALWSFGYDYVPEHFANEIKDPREENHYHILQEE